MNVSIAARQRRCFIGACLMVSAGAVNAAAAQSPVGAHAATPTASAAQPPQISDEDDDAVLSPAEPDFVVVNLPTGMRLPLFKGNFRLTHRFAGNLKDGTFREQASNLFGIDQGAIIGFEYRVAVAPGVQAAFYRSSFSKTIQLHGKYDALRQRESMPFSMSALASIEGTNNFQEQYTPAVGLVVSRIIGTRLAGYLTPIWAHNTAASLGAVAHAHDHDHYTTSPSAEPLHVRQSTTFVGMGTRVRLGGRTYLAAEIAPRVAGYAPDEPAYGVSIETRLGAHMFSMTFTNSFGTTFGQVARGGTSDTLYLGFNLGRKFY